MKNAPPVDYTNDDYKVTSTYKVYDMYKLTEQESDGDTMFVFNVDKQGKETYQIKLTKGANGCITQDGINDLKQASKEQQQEEQQVV